MYGPVIALNVRVKWYDLTLKSVTSTSMLHYIHVYTRNHARRTIYRYLSTTKDSTLIVSDEDWSKWSERGLQSFTIPLQHNKRHKDERAVLTVIQKEGNENALLWLPGIDASPADKMSICTFIL